MKMKQLNNYIITRMKQNIEKMGKDKVLQVIESLPKAITRARYRKFYFEVVGEA